MPKAKAFAKTPLLKTVNRADPPPEPIGKGDPPRPLSNVRVLDLSRIIAGPVAGRTLAPHGADVLLINGPHLPYIPPLVIANDRGKRPDMLALRDANGRDSLRALLHDAAVFMQCSRSGAPAASGIST